MTMLKGNCDESRTINTMVIMDTTQISGPAKQLFQFVENMGNSEFNFTLCTFHKKGEKERTEFIEAAKRYFRLVRTLHERFRFDPRIFCQSSNLCRSENIKILQTHGYKAAVIGLYCKYMMGVKWVAFTHGWTNEDIKVKFYNLLEPFFLRFSDIVISVSDALKKKMIKYGVPREKIVTVYNAIDVNLDNEFLNIYSNIRRIYNIPKEAKVILVIGRMSPEKGHRYFIDAFAKLTEKYPDIYALMVGKGQEEKRLRGLCISLGLDHRIKFVGYQKDVYPFYKSSNLMVLPSLSEGLPNVVLESLAYGVPVIATSVGGVPEIIIDGYNGLLVPPRDSESMSDAIIKVLQDESFKNTLVKNGKETIRNKFSPIARMNQIKKAYYIVLGVKQAL